MLYYTSPAAIAIFLFFVAAVLGLSFYLGSRARSASGFFAAHGQVHWAVNGIAFAGDYLSAASFLGICGLIAFYGYDGFLYSIGYLAGWIVALFLIAEPIKRLGKFTFADALDAKFNARGIKFAAALSTMIISVFYLIPQMVGAGALITPLLGLPHWVGVLIVGVTVTLIVVTAGMVSTTWVQFIKGSLLVMFCALIVVMLLGRGFHVTPTTADASSHPFHILPESQVLAMGTPLPADGGWKDKPYLRVQEPSGTISVWRKITPASPPPAGGPSLKPPPQEAAAGPNAVPAGAVMYSETQILTSSPQGPLVNGKPQSRENDIRPVGTISALPGGKTETGPLGPLSFLSTLNDSTIVTWGKETVKDAKGVASTVFYQVPRKGADLLTPGASPTFAGVRSSDPAKKLDFISLMLALFAGTASLPHILIRYYTVKDAASARKSTLVGIAAIGFFYILTLYLGLGAMASGALDPTDSNMAAPLLAKSFNNTLFAIISAIAFTTVLGTVSGLLMAGAGAVAHDLLETFFRVGMTEKAKVRHAKVACITLGVGAMILGVLFKNLNVSFLVGWAFNIAASANLPALIMLLFWRRTTSQGITAAILVGMISSLAWILLSQQCYRDVYGIDPRLSPIPFSQPALVTIPLGFVTLIVVSLLTARRTAGRPAKPATQGAPHTAQG
jgi:cation/acetate symporter